MSGTGVRGHTQKVFAGERDRDGRPLDPRDSSEFLSLVQPCELRPAPTGSGEGGGGAMLA